MNIIYIIIWIILTKIKWVKQNDYQNLSKYEIGFGFDQVNLFV